MSVFPIRIRTRSASRNAPTNFRCVRVVVQIKNKTTERKALWKLFIRHVFFLFFFSLESRFLSTTIQLIMGEKTWSGDYQVVHIHWFPNKAPTPPVCGHPLFISTVFIWKKVHYIVAALFCLVLFMFYMPVVTRAQTPKTHGGWHLKIVRHFLSLSRCVFEEARKWTRLYLQSNSILFCFNTTERDTKR